MPQRFQLRIKDIFFFRDGRTVLAGPIEGGEKTIIEAGPAAILVNGEKTASVVIEPEMIASRALPMERLEMRAVATRDATGLSREMVETKECKLEGTMRFSGHRNLVGIDSPPADYVPDDMTLGPRLPEGWDGDAWMKSDGAAFFLRAWNKANARYAISEAEQFEVARTKLLEEIRAGGRQVEIRIKETHENRH